MGGGQMDAGEETIKDVKKHQAMGRFVPQLLKIVACSMSDGTG